MLKPSKPLVPLLQPVGWLPPANKRVEHSTTLPSTGEPCTGAQSPSRLARSLLCPLLQRAEK